METNCDYEDFCGKCSNYFENHPINLKELCITKSVIRTTDFFKCIEDTVETETPETDKEVSTVEDYAELFKVFDKYPSNLQRKPKKRELLRTNSVTLKGIDAIQDQASLCFSNLSLNTTRIDESPSAATVYKDYKNFVQKLQLLQNEASSLEKEQSVYLKKIAQLEIFAQQLSKLLPREQEAPDAFTTEEMARLDAVAENMKELNYLNSQDLERLANPKGPAARRLETVVDVLNYTLTQINS